jgi:uncharacterized membrane protein
MDAPLELIISVYNDPQQASQVLADLKKVGGDGNFEIKNAAVLVKDAKGHVRMNESEDVSPGRGALFGAITGGLIGLLAGPAGAVAGALAGAATGGVTASVVDMGFSNDQLADLRASMPANSSALITLIEHTWVDKLVSELESRQGKLFRHEVDSDLSDQYGE